MNLGERITFVQLLEKGYPVEIPIIQRDYAQGRDTVSEVREQFLLTIFNTLNTSPDLLCDPLDLDFIYGSIEGDDCKRFSPLDGQQRLTTLFLLHWYLAALDGRSNEFRSLVLDGEDLKFTYQTRISSSEFFYALSKSELEIRNLLSGNPASALSRTIQDSQWFFLSWRLDPTIRSALIMLDAMHAKFSQTSGFYERLIQSNKPYITFQFLNLREFGLSDELYIKMNARGKPLTPFENFKARLEQLLDKVFPDKRLFLAGRELSVKEYFSHQIDTQWADLFWHYRNSQTNSFDEEIMNFIRLFVSVHYTLDKQDWLNGLGQLRDSQYDFTFVKYSELGCFPNIVLNNLIKFLDSVSASNNGYLKFLGNIVLYDEDEIFKQSLVKMNPRSRTGLDYTQSVQFFAYCSFIVKFHNEVDTIKFTEYMRVIKNLTVNTPYNNLGEFQRSLSSVNKLVEYSDNFLTFIANPNTYKTIDGFYFQQVREEHIKANLILKGEDWKRAVLQAEAHQYFDGQIEFLLSFCGVLDFFNQHQHVNWTDEENLIFLEKFNSYFNKASVVFGSKGLSVFPDYIWERALLSKGNYLIEKGRNLSFLDDNDRDASWKRLLRGAEQIRDSNEINNKRALVKSVLENFNPDDSLNSLKKIIDDADISDRWRAMIVKYPEIINYCKHRFIRKYSDDNILVLTKTKTSGAHYELYSLYLYFDFFRSRLLQKQMAPFSSVALVDSITEDEKSYLKLIGFKFNGAGVDCQILYLAGKYKIKFIFSLENPDLTLLKQGLITTFQFKEIPNSRLDKEVSFTEIKDTLSGLFDFLSSIIDGVSDV